ncbi:UBX domain-containing protein 4 [Xyrichtys novacula]|uniref:UBX domain-containing protein 4 n=1 Tax=Xyrichtys novacula TaxID=13765 RepID=A0AAV1H053_XYRNO|nr:UBX domain-containing protein 4 [Xyrichtys novacula]
MRQCVYNSVLIFHSETCVQFSQIYPVVCIPSSYFIGENGIPLVVVAGSVSPEELIQRIEKVKQLHAQQIAPNTGAPEETGPCNSTASGPGPAQEPLPQQEQEPETGAELGASVVSASDPGPSAPTTSEPTKASLSASPDEYQSSHHQTEENLEAKVQRLTKKLEERREQKKMGEAENEIKKENERRKVGKDLQDFKKKQEEEKTRRLLEERNREKAEEKAARERVKQQIAQDRADRAARYAQIQEEDRAAKEAAQQARQAQQEARKETLLRERNTVARIQFRLPDGSSITNQFPSQTRLQEARQFAAQEVGSRYGNFSLATMFPRREFTGEDLEKTLLELELAPSASIVLLPQSSRPANTVAQSSGGGIWAVLGTLLYPLLAVWRFLSSFLFTSPPPPGTASRGPAHHQPNSYTKPTPASDKTNRETLEKRPKDFKKDGKICRLRTQEDSEDDNNTWNGNSTQQM